MSKERKVSGEKKTYEITGVSSYAHVFSFEVEASSKKEAKKIAEEMDNVWDDSSSAEFQRVLIDPPVEIDA